MDAQGHPTCDPHAIDPGAGGMLPPLWGPRIRSQGFRPVVDGRNAHARPCGGFGRLYSEKRWGANVFLQLIDPDAFAGRDAFLRQMDFLTGRCHTNAPIDPANPVRMPGEMAQRRMREAERLGLDVAPKVREALLTAAKRYGIAFPVPLT